MQYIWANYNISRTWIVRLFGMIALYIHHDSRLRENRVPAWWNSPRYIGDTVVYYMNYNHWSSITGWWYTYPSEKYEFVSWDDDIPNIWKVIIHARSKAPTSIPIDHPFLLVLARLRSSLVSPYIKWTHAGWGTIEFIGKYHDFKGTHH